MNTPRQKTPGSRALTAALALAAMALLGSADAQYAERRELPGSDHKNVDASGRSPKERRVRAIHSEIVQQPGGTLQIQFTDPYLAYMLGRNLNFREFEEHDGVLSAQKTGTGGIGNLGGPMPDGTTAKLTLQNQTSCIACHNIPNGNPGGGMNIAKDSGFGRDTPHYFGAGLIEMLALQTRLDLLDQVDGNGDGWVSIAEAQAAPASITIQPHPGSAQLVNYGNPQLDGGATGRPQLDNIIRPWFVDANGDWVEGATSVDGVTTFGYNFELVVFGWGQGPGRDALNPTVRFFLIDAFGAHAGLEAHDPTTMDDPDGDGISKPSNAGAIQFPATHQPPDQGVEVGAGLGIGGYSLADPDGDGYCTEISEGDLDYGEWFMLNLPAPSFAGTAAEYDAGVALMDQMACTSCHVADWKILEADGTHNGDRRFFDFDVTWDDVDQRLEGELVPLFDLLGIGGDPLHAPRLGAFDVEGIFSDLRHHDMGDEFAEIGFGGTIGRVWRTPPLWGVGTSFPWGHDGRSLTLDHAIRRHGGEGATSAALYAGASRADRDALVRFLRKLVLYDIESLPADIDGDGLIADQLIVEGKLTGGERFNPEWLFDDPAQIFGTFVNEDGEIVNVLSVVNLEQAYKLELQYREDRDEEDGDGWPDEWDPDPLTIGWYDGVNNPPWWLDPTSGRN